MAHKGLYLFNVLCHENGIVKWKGKVCIPYSSYLRRKFMNDKHDVPHTRNPGVDKIIQLVRRTFWWPGLARDVHTYIQQCFMCQVNKAERVKKPGLLHPLQVREHNWDISDRDIKFTGHFWKLLFDKQKVSLKMSSGDHPQTDGHIERVNQILEEILRAYAPKVNIVSFAPKVNVVSLHRTLSMPKKYPSASKFLMNLQENLKIAKAKMQQATDRAKEYVDRKRFVDLGKIVKKLSEVVYQLELPLDCRVHRVFHVNKLRKYISKDDNLIEGIVSLQESDSTYHSPDRILDWRQKQLRNHVIEEYLVA
ncbi:hypothetical protein KP509_13G041300 [Ceratopteris richardii]|uniref:Integrase zinc-binding domain-containing protein n=1 Tax=Ceratopteris richardii TaxID=49495 RepID=A0A8T2TKG0_CERRI|nr:hypothetical protein KP509_13G041300 [Ceratopteris richardii]